MFESFQPHVHEHLVIDLRLLEQNIPSVTVLFTFFDGLTEGEFACTALFARLTKPLTLSLFCLFSPLRDKPLAKLRIGTKESGNVLKEGLGPCNLLFRDKRKTRSAPLCRLTHAHG